LPAISRLLSDLATTGHGCDTTVTISTSSDTVFANGIKVVRKGDECSPHTIPSGPSCVPHSAVINVGSATVFINGKKCARIGDSTDGGALIEGSPNVFAGG